MLNKEVIERYSEQTYQYASDWLGSPVAKIHRAKICGLLNGILLARLRCVGMEGKMVTYHGPEVDHHDFIELEEEWTIDSNWQQFLNKPGEKLPKVLICKKSTLPDVLSEFGIPQSKHRIWLTAT